MRVIWSPFNSLSPSALLQVDSAAALLAALTADPADARAQHLLRLLGTRAGSVVCTEVAAIN